jgi:hypothetical protein
MLSFCQVEIKSDTKKIKLLLNNLNLNIIMLMNLYVTVTKNACRSKFCDKMLAAAAPSWRLHIYYIDIELFLICVILTPR